MSRSNKEDPAYLSAISMATDKSGAAIDTRHQVKGLFQVTWSGADQVDATVKAQESNDGSNWTDISGKTATLDAASGSKTVRLAPADLLGAYVRLVFDNGTCAAGTLTVKYFFQGA